MTEKQMAEKQTTKNQTTENSTTENQKTENQTTQKKQGKKPTNKKAVLGVSILIVLLAAMGILYGRFREKPVEGTKAITIEVVNKAKESTIYELRTDAQFLKEAMEEAEGLEFEGSEGQYGMTISSINGEVADFTKENSYWSFYVNDGYCNYGVDSQPVEDGDAFKIVYEVYTAQ